MDLEAILGFHREGPYMSEREPSTADQPENRDNGTEMPKEQTATAPPSVDIRTMRPAEDPESLGSSEYYQETEKADSSAATPPVQVTDDPD